MIKKGLELYTTSPTYIELINGKWSWSCCLLCTSPYYFYLCKPFCKFRKATHREFVEYQLSKGERKV